MPCSDGRDKFALDTFLTCAVQDSAKIIQVSTIFANCCKLIFLQIEFGRCREKRMRKPYDHTSNM